MELASGDRERGAFDSQDELAVSPDGAYLAWSMPGDGRLHLRDATGHEQILARYGRRMRFSPDGKWLAAITDIGRGDWHKLVAWELATGKTQSLEVGEHFGRFEWAPDGLVIGERNELAYVTLAGVRTSLVKVSSPERIDRFLVAGHRVALFVATDRKLVLELLDPDHPEQIRELGAVSGESVENADASPDGARFVFATSTGLYVVDGNSTPRELSSRRDIHSLWYAADGRLAYAASGGTTVLEGKRARRIEPPDPTRMMRFEKGSSRVLVAAGHALLAWDPATGRNTALASVAADDELLGGDRYQGGVVLWSGREGQPGRRPELYRVTRVLHVGTDATVRELEKVEGLVDEATIRERTFPHAQPPDVTARLQAILHDPLQSGLTHIDTNPQGTRALVCFRPRGDGKAPHDFAWVDLTTSQTIDLPIEGCWNRLAWLSPDGEQVAFSDHGASRGVTRELELLAVHGGAPPRSLGEGYTDIVFGGHGRVGFVSHRGVRVVDAQHDSLFETDGPVEMLQLTNDRVMFAVGGEVIAWDVDKAARSVLARAPDGQRIVGFAVERDGVRLATVQ